MDPEGLREPERLVLINLDLMLESEVTGIAVVLSSAQLEQVADRLKWTSACPGLESEPVLMFAWTGLAE